DAAGAASETVADDKGILSVTDFPAAVAELRDRTGSRPLLMAGMIGSNRGWREVPYVKAPAGLAEIAAAVTWVEPGVGIVPGVSFVDGDLRADIMRGEEVPLLGACATDGPECDGLICHPGTHTKWVEMEDGRIARFRTVMTGDVFAALAQKSILSDLLAHPAPVDDAFLAGVDHALANADLTAELFAVRARVILGKAEAVHAASYVSGLLIGSDVKIGLGRLRADVVPVLGSPALTARFAVALARAGRESVERDGDAAFLAGMNAIAGALP
ncbi:MAG: 2-dehydro-3-deoxygalactonokinase, partial [Janthinobacterium lividum]